MSRGDCRGLESWRGFHSVGRHGLRVRCLRVYTEGVLLSAWPQFVSLLPPFRLRSRRPALSRGIRTSPSSSLICGACVQTGCRRRALPFLGAHHPEARVLKLRIWRKRHRHTNPKRKRGNGLRPLSSSLALRVHMKTTTPAPRNGRARRRVSFAPARHRGSLQAVRRNLLSQHMLRPSPWRRIALTLDDA